jgi:hypothetical protein
MGRFVRVVEGQDLASLTYEMYRDSRVQGFEEQIGRA